MKRNLPILCGNLKMDVDELHKKIFNTKASSGCKTPEIIENLVNEFDYEEIRDIIETIYCKECRSNLQYNTCGRAISLELTKITCK